MKAVRFQHLGAVGLSLFLAASGYAGSLPRADKLLLFIFQKKVNVPYVQVQKMRLNVASADTMTLKVEADVDGKIKTTMLYPMKYQGMSSIDDGVTWKTFDPDQKVIHIGTSQRTLSTEPHMRIGSVKKNYTLSVTKDAVAGRPTYCISAISRWKPMPNRKIWVDCHTWVLLRYEVETDAKTSVALIDTKSIEFRHHMKVDSKFAMNTEGWREVRALAGRNIDDLNSELQRLHIPISIPSQLPYGFTAESFQILNGPDKPIFTARLSDGLAISNLYVAGKGGADLGDLSQSMIKVRVQGVTIFMQADLPPAIVRAIIDAVVITSKNRK